MRLDTYLSENGYFESRNRALEAIKAGMVTVDGKIGKPSTPCNENTNVVVENEKFFVSRAGRKLDAFLSDYNIDMSEKKALDIGSSTGGFAQILLEHSVAELTCVDVGKDQLHSIIRNNERVTVREECDIRSFEGNSFDMVSCDVSFISVLEIINDIDRLAIGDIVILYKPQFEVGRLAKRDSRGVVVDIDAIRFAREKFELCCVNLGWSLLRNEPSKLQGKEGNLEYFYHYNKSVN
jgi:23S rRNA (cytidine1920-2'-O)/16S rRNA (cytidine1409-2'-O)-methyltransferase